MVAGDNVNTIGVSKQAVVPTSASRRTEGPYEQVLNPQGYLNNREITNLPGIYLVKGSRDTIIVNREKVASRLGYKLLGAAKTVNRGYHGSVDWETSENVTRSLRLNDTGALEVFYKGNWILLKSYAPFTRANFTTWWSTPQLTDFLLFGVGTPEVQMWSGAIGEIASSTTNSLTLKGYLSESTIALVNNGSNPPTITDSANGFLAAFFAPHDVITISIQVVYTATTIAFVNPTTITDSANGFVTAGIKVGDKIFVAGSPNNSSDFTVTAVSAGSITVADADLTSELAGASITITANSPNDGQYTISAVTAGVITLSEEDSLTNEAAGRVTIIQRPGSTWAELGFLNADVVDHQSGESQARGVIVNGTTYFYSGGENTGTITSISPAVSGVSAGNIALQSIIGIRPAALVNFDIDLIYQINNYVFYGSLTSRDFYFSHDDDFTNFAFSTPRNPGEGGTGTLSSTPTAFVDDTTGNLWISARKDDWYELTFTLQSDGSESLVVNKPTTATGQGAQSQGCVIKVKNQVAFLSFEPTIDTLGRIPLINTPQSVPLSFPIKNDILSYDLTDAQGVYYQNQIFMTLPVEGIVLIYDLENEMWQPPQYLPVGRLALIDIDGSGVQVLCGHSSFGNETYQLFAPNAYDDNGAIINFVAAFGYDNFGTRFTQKNCDEFPVEAYMSENTILKDTMYYDYEGATDIRTFMIKGNDAPTRFAPRRPGGFGQNEEGSQPLGSLATPIEDLSKIRVINTTTNLDFFERQRIFSTSSKQARFAIISYGENIRLADNIPSFIKK